MSELPSLSNDRIVKALQRAGFVVVLDSEEVTFACRNGQQKVF